MNLTNPVYLPPQETEEKVETYLKSPLIVETRITIIEKPKVRSYGDDVKVVGVDASQCVIYVQKIGALKISGYGKAINYPTNSNEPVVGGVVKTAESKAGHLALVIGTTDSTITLREANYESGKLTERTLPKDDARILGYIN